MRVDCSLGGFALDSRETAKRAIDTHVLIQVCGLTALVIGGQKGTGPH